MNVELQRLVTGDGPERLTPADTVDDVLRNLDHVITWAETAESPIGYFAVVFKGSTMAVRAAIDEGLFDDGPRMQRFDVMLAQRYFDALNAYFHPDAHDEINLAWQVSLIGCENSSTTILQHMLSGLNAHVSYDLGVAAIRVSPDELNLLKSDFNLINALLASQIRGLFDAFETLSPTFKWIRRVVPDEVGIVRRLLVKFRQAAWYFAIDMAMHPDRAAQLRLFHVSWTAAICAWYLKPPGKWTPFPWLVRAIARNENRNVSANLRMLDSFACTPVQLDRAFL
jgi:hypothetical protein